MNSGKQIDAVNLAFAFELTEQFPPVELLKSYLTEAKRSSSQGGPGNASPAVQVSVPLLDNLHYTLLFKRKWRDVPMHIA